MAAGKDELESMRTDTWLWVARFVKTRALAVDAVNGGRVQVNGVRVKPSKPIKPGDRVEITIGQDRHRVDVTGLARRRGSATDAALLYTERPEDRAEREVLAEQRRLSYPSVRDMGGRPTKKDRRRINEIRGREQR